MKRVFLAILLVVLLFGLIEVAMYVNCDTPYAFVYSGTGKIRNFEIVSMNKKGYTKVYPGDKNFKILTEGKYEVVWIAPKDPE